MGSISTMMTIGNQLIKLLKTQGLLCTGLLCLSLVLWPYSIAQELDASHTNLPIISHETGWLSFFGIGYWHYQLFGCQAERPNPQSSWQSYCLAQDSNWQELLILHESSLEISQLEAVHFSIALAHLNQLTPAVNLLKHTVAGNLKSTQATDILKYLKQPACLPPPVQLITPSPTKENKEFFQRLFETWHLQQSNQTSYLDIPS